MENQNINEQNYSNPVQNYSNNDVPQEIKKWNWGAFMFNIAWGIGNNSYLTLLCLIPLFNLVWIFICGAKGNEWAWKNNNYSSTDEFFLVQKTWNKAGFVMFNIALIFIVIYVLLIAIVIGIWVFLFGAIMFAFVPALVDFLDTLIAVKKGRA